MKDRVTAIQDALYAALDQTETVEQELSTVQDVLREALHRVETMEEDYFGRIGHNEKGVSDERSN